MAGYGSQTTGLNYLEFSLINTLDLGWWGKAKESELKNEALAGVERCWGGVEVGGFI